MTERQYLEAWLREVTEGLLARRLMAVWRGEARVTLHHGPEVAEVDCRKPEELSDAD
jgi:hypothetical protein